MANTNAKNDEQNERPNWGSVPVPDPTKLTTEAVTRLSDQLKELFGQRFEAVDKELARLNRALDQRPEAIVVEINHLRALVDKQFEGVKEQFNARDREVAGALIAQKTYVEEQNKSNALAAAKAETGFDKRIEGIDSKINLQTKTNDDKISDLKDRLTAIESNKVGSVDTIRWLFGAIAAIAALVAVYSFSQQNAHIIVEKPNTVTMQQPQP